MWISPTGDVDIKGANIHHNEAMLGGGMYIYSQNDPSICKTVKAKNINVYANKSQKGGGICTTCNGYISLENSRIEDNSSSEYGPGLLIDYYARAYIKNCVIKNNKLNTRKEDIFCTY